MTIGNLDSFIDVINQRNFPPFRASYLATLDRPLFRIGELVIIIDEKTFKFGGEVATKGTNEMVS